MIGWLAPRPRPAAWCHHCWSDGHWDSEPPRRFKHAAGSFYCFICDEVSTDECAFGWLAEHSQHITPEDEIYTEERVRLRTGSGVYAWIPGDHAERYRSVRYIELLERFEWDEEQAPRWLVARPAEYDALLLQLATVADQCERFAGEIAGPDAAVTDVVLRVLRSPRRLRAWRSWLTGMEQILTALRKALGDQHPTRREIERTWGNEALAAAWATGAPTGPAMNTTCSTCGAPTAPYGPPPHECAPCFVRRVEAGRA